MGLMDEVKLAPLWLQSDEEVSSKTGEEQIPADLACYITISPTNNRKKMPKTPTKTNAPPSLL